jgi:Tfp pilus assembly protein PilF
VAAGIVTARRTLVWRDDLAFWRNTIAAVPEEGFAHLKLGLVLYQRGDLAGAEAEYRDAMAQRLDRLQQAITENNLGHLLLRQRRFAEAEPLFRSAIEPGPRFAGPYRGLAESVWARTAAAGEPPPAEVRALLETAVRVEPADARSALLLGQAWLAEGNRAEAARWFVRSAQAAPGSASAAQARAALAALEGH